MSIVRSASATTVVSSEAESFATTKSVDVLDTSAVFSKIVPAAVPAGTRTVMSSVSIAPSAIGPIVQTPVPETYVPTDSVALTNVRPSGIRSSTVTPVASDGPRFSTVMV